MNVNMERNPLKKLSPSTNASTSPLATASCVWAEEGYSLIVGTKSYCRHHASKSEIEIFPRSTAMVIVLI